MEDITQDVIAVDTTPQEAADNIDKAKMLNTSPDTYKNLKPELQKTVQKLEAPTQVTRGVANYARQSNQNAAIIKNDPNELSTIEKIGKHIYHTVVDRPNSTQDLVELRNKQMDNPKLMSQGEMQAIEALNKEMREDQSFGLETSEKVPGEILGAASEFVRGIYRHKEMVASATIATGVAGVVATAPIPVPGARIVGLKAGLTVGLSHGVLAASFMDGYKTSKALMYNELSYMRDDKGKPLNLDVEKKADISRGVALVQGAAIAFVGRALIKNNPFLKQFISPTAMIKLIQNPAKRALVDVIASIGNSIKVGATSGVVADVAKMFGEEFAKTDGSEDAMLNVLHKISSKEGMKRLGHTALISGGSAGVISTTLGGLTYNRLRKNYVLQNKFVKNVKAKIGDTHEIVVRDDKSVSIEPKLGKGQQAKPDAPNNVARAEKALTVKEGFEHVSKIANSTELKGHSPSEMSAVKRMIFAQVGLNRNVFTHIEDLHEWAGTDEKKLKVVANIIDKSGTLATQVGAPVDFPAHEFSDLVDEFPELDEYLRVNPEDPNYKEAQVYKDRLAEADAKRMEFTSKLGLGEQLTPEQEAEIAEPIQEAREAFTEYEFVNRPTFTPTIENALTDNEVGKFNDAIIRARQETVQSLKGDVDKLFKTEENKLFKTINQEDIDETIRSYDRQLKILDHFDPKQTGDVADALTSNHKKKGYSPFAIDPKSLPEDLRAIFLEHPTLKKRKIFVEGGLHIEESAAMVGLKNGEDLLTLLIETPTRNQILKNRGERKAELRARIEDSLAPSKMQAMDNALNNLNKAHMREAKFMRTKEWTQNKKAITRVFRPMPVIEEIRLKAEAEINQTLIKDLNFRKYVVGGNQQDAAAGKHMFKMEVNKAFKAKENAIYNNELVRATVKMKVRVARAEKFLKKLNKPSVIKELKDAKMYSPVLEVLDIFKLDTSKKGLSEKGSFDKWVKQQVENGNVNFEIPDRFNDVRESANEMTAEQYLAINDRLQSVLHQAKFKNKLYKKFKAKAMIQTRESVVEKAVSLIEQHPGFDPRKATLTVDNSVNPIEAAKAMLDPMGTIIDNIKVNATTLDKEIPGEFFYELIPQQIVNGRTTKRQLMEDITNHLKKVKEHYGSDEFNKSYNDFRNISEFADFQTLGNGIVPKSRLLLMLASMGDPDGKSKIGNHVNSKGEKIDPKTILKILERELTHEDAVFVNNFYWEPYKSLEGKSFALHKSTTGQEPTMVKGVPFEFKGRMIPGGYFPLNYVTTPDDVAIDTFIDGLEKKIGTLYGIGDGSFYGKLRAAEHTEQGRFEERGATNRIIDHDPRHHINNLDEIAHDLAFREVGIDLLKILKNPILKKAIKSVLGPAKYGSMVNSVIETVGKTEEANNIYFPEQRALLDRLISNLYTGHAIAVLAYSASSITIQATSLPFIALRMGKKGARHLTATSGLIMVNPYQIGDFEELAIQMNPDIRFARDGIDDALIQNQHDFIPSTSKFFRKHSKTAQKFSALSEAQKAVNNFGMSGMGEADRIVKIITTLGAARQFFAGDTEAYPLSKLAKMTDEAKTLAMRQYVKQISDLAATSSAVEDKTFLEKNSFGKHLTRFWTDGRSQLNTTAAQGRKIKWHTQDSYKHFQLGVEDVKRSRKEKDNKESRQKAKDNFKQSASSAKKAGGTALATVIVLATAKLYYDTIQGNDTPFTNISDVKSMNDVKELGIEGAVYMANAVPDFTISQMPGARDVQYGYSSKRRSDYKSVSMPFTSIQSDIATGAKALTDMLRMAIGGGGRISETELKGLLRSGSYLVKGYPVNGMFKIKEALEKSDLVQDSLDDMGSTFKNLSNTIDEYIEQFKDVPEAQEYITDLKAIKTELIPEQYSPDISNLIPETTKEQIKQTSSEGQWTKLDEDTGAVGIYQFTEERWLDISRSAPNLQLTENGRVSKDPVQQERAMNWSVEDNTRGFMAHKIPVNERNLFGAHKFGFDNYTRIFEAKSTDKLSKVLGEDADDPVFKNFKTVKSVKDYIAREVKNVED